MPVVLIDANIEGQGSLIWMRMQTSEWRDLTAELGVIIQTFRDVGLDPASADDVVWRFCQAHDYYLLTSNRNEESEHSLEATLRREGTPTSLPVFTLPLADRVYYSTTFLERVVEKLLDYVLDADNIRGPGDCISHDSLIQYFPGRWFVLNLLRSTAPIPNLDYLFAGSTPIRNLTEEIGEVIINTVRERMPEPCRQHLPELERSGAR